MSTGEQSHPRTAWLAHHFVPLMVIALTPLAVDSVFPGIDALGYLCMLATPMAWVVLIASGRHDSMLCEACMAEFPVDGDAQATEKLGALRYHHCYSAWANLLIFVTWVASLWVSSLWLLVCVWFFVDHRHTTTHRRLTLWCPWCRHRRGDDEATVAPRPVPTARGDR